MDEQRRASHILGFLLDIPATAGTYRGGRVIPSPIPRQVRKGAIVAGGQTPSRPPKYGNIKTMYNGRLYDSKAEAAYAQRLDWLKLAGEIQSWEAQPHYILHDSNGGKLTTFIPDFLVTSLDGSQYLADCKGMTDSRSPAWRLFQLKSKLLKAEYGLDVRVVT